MRDRQAAFDRYAMRLALRAAKLGDPSPNPHVGAVLTQADKVIAVGHHARAGLAHAEVAAIAQAGEKARGATLYITVDPCNHHGRTGPCTEAILAAGIARIVVGCADPAPHVPGALERLQAAGIEITRGILQAQAERLIADFAKHRRTGRPWVTLKAAISLDGHTATRTGESRWISGEASRRQAHRLRAQADAVMVGSGTVLADDAQLTVRHVEGRNPLRVVLDTHLRTSPTAKIIQPTSRLPTLLLHGPAADEKRRQALQAAGAECCALPCHDDRIDLSAALDELGRRGIVRLLVEGGPTLHGTLLRQSLADSVSLFVAPLLLGDPTALPLADAGPLTRLADGWRLTKPRIKRLDDDLWIQADLAR